MEKSEYYIVVLVVVCNVFVAGENLRMPSCPAYAARTLTACNCFSGTSFPDLCLNGGLCMSDNLANFNCLCPPDITGTRCQGSATCIVGSPTDCPTNSICVGPSVALDGVCSCSPGFVGIISAGRLECIPADDECANTPGLCLNGATCMDLPVNFECICAPGFMGDNCGTDINECDTPNFCGAGGTCVNASPGFTCICPPGRAGDMCQDAVGSDSNSDSDTDPSSDGSNSAESAS